MEEKPKRTWQEAVVRWLKEHEHKKSIDKDKQRLKILDQWFRGVLLSDIDRNLVDRAKEERKDQYKMCNGKVGRDKVSKAEVNRMLALLRSILFAARDDWEWIESCPKIKLFKEPKRRVRWLRPEEAARLVEELPAHLKAVVRMSLATGLREQNVLGLKWQNIDLARRVAWIDGDETKNAKALSVPLNDEAMNVLLAERFKHDENVFTYRGMPLKGANTRAWQNALKRAGIENFRFHDLRHTWASWHVQNGTSLNVLQELGSWESVEMVRRYAHLAPDTLATAAANSLPEWHKNVTAG